MTVDPRPTSDDDLDFTRASMARWLSPRLLGQAALRVVISGVFGEYLDKREVMAALPAGEPEDLSGQDEAWVDYVSDLGDGFDATYAMASLLAQPTLQLPFGDELAVTTPRGQLLVMGGDQCYPTACASGYENKVVGPYRAARPAIDKSDEPSLYAIPGNHDWYDGLTSFLRVFCQGANIGRWRTRQARSYFAVQLPHRWWLWGIDVQFNTYVDDPQRRYFLERAAQLQPGDGVILCTATPAWVNCNRGDPECYAVLDWFDRTMIQPTGAVAQVMLSGDSHHYVHYAEVDGPRHRITAGGGGAFLSATHGLPEHLTVPPVESRARHKTEPRRYQLTARFPDRADSEKIATRAFILPWRNKGFVGLMGVVQAIVAMAVWTSLLSRGGIRDASYPTLLSGLVRSLPAVLTTLLVWLMLVAFTKQSRRPAGIVVGTLHATVQLALGVAVTYLGVHVLSGVSDRWLLTSVVAFDMIVGGLLASEVVAAYLYLADRFAGFNTNELFSSMSSGDRKNFLRLHIARDGSLTVFPVGLRDVPRRWQFAPLGAADDPWLVPEKPLQPMLIEAPVRIEHPVVPAPIPAQVVPPATQVSA
ncbi:MAG: hypothetical protein QOJ03_862 [Frankiaceae bacterium]|jgi:hypothetical protein|nr:hypothetical protein [Frankiaceae bacterium]